MYFKNNYNIDIMDDREQLYLGTHTVDANINDTRSYPAGRKQANNVVNIRPYKYFYSDNKEKVNGILTNIGVYVPVLSTNVENLKIDKIVNYFDIFYAVSFV